MQENAYKIIALNEVGSTNNYANKLIASGAKEGTVVLAQFQTRGKGQSGNQWESESGKNLLASLILYPDFLEAANQFLLSKITSLAIAGFLKNYVEEVTIKWPNDIYVKNRKIAGILIENSIKGTKIDSSVVGFGINLNQETFRTAPNPVSLKQLTGANFDGEKVFHEIWLQIHKWYDILKLGNRSEINDVYKSNLYRLNEWSRYKKGNEYFDARISGIGEFGQLKLQSRDGIVREFMFKEVEYVL